MKPTLRSTNYTHSRFGLKRAMIKSYAPNTAVISNIRKLVHNLGFDCSLLNDSEILGLEDVIYEYEQNGDKDTLLDVLRFLSA